MTSTVAAPPIVPGTSDRLAWLDQLRGFAVFLMAVDHVLLVIEPANSLRFTLTRLSLPIFAVLVGHLWRPGWRWRHWQVLRAALVATVAGGLVGVGQPDILWLLLGAIVALHLPVAPLWLVVLGLLQAWNLPLDWTGYQPGYVLAWVALGRIVTTDQLRALSVGATTGRGFDWLGRHALSFYVLHLVALAVYRGLAFSLLNG